MLQRLAENACAIQSISIRSVRHTMNTNCNNNAELARNLGTKHHKWKRSPCWIFVFVSFRVINIIYIRNVHAPLLSSRAPIPMRSNYGVPNKAVPNRKICFHFFLLFFFVLCTIFDFPIRFKNRWVYKFGPMQSSAVVPQGLLLAFGVANN